MSQHSGRTEYAGDSNVPDILEVHVEGEEGGLLEVEVTFNVPIVFEGFCGAFYMDGSYSMFNSGMYPDPKDDDGGGFLSKMRHRGESSGQVYPVTKVMREVVPYIGGLDATGTCLAAYGMCGDGSQVESLGEISPDQGATMVFNGPKQPGNGTYLLPAIRHWVQYVQGQAGTKVAAGIFVTDGALHDIDQVVEYIYSQLGPAIANGSFPKATISVVGVGPDVDHDQLERLEHDTTNEDLGIREIVHAEPASTIGQLPELVAHLISLDAVAFTGGATVVVAGTDQVIKSYEGDVPAVLVLEVPVGVTNLVIKAGGQDMPFSLPAEH